MSLAADSFPKYGSRGDSMAFRIADGVTLFRGGLVGIVAGYLNDWADGATDLMVGLVIGGDARNDGTALLGETSDTYPPEGLCRIDGVTLKHLSGVVGAAGAALTIADVGKTVYCPDDDINTNGTLATTNATHPVGILTRFTAAADVDVTLLSMMEFAGQRLA